MLFIVGTIFGIAMLALFWWMRSKAIKVSWYEYLIGGIGLLLLMFAVQNWLGAIREGEPAAIMWYLLFFGVPAIVLLLVAAVGAWRRNAASA